MQQIPKILDSNILIKNENFKCTKQVLQLDTQREFKRENVILKRYLRTIKENKKAHLITHTNHILKDNKILIYKFIH